MKKIALVQNYDKLGGAEKSGLEQATLLKMFKVDIYTPKINQNSEMLNSIPFAMPKAFFKLSRSKKSSYVLAIFSLFQWIVFSHKIQLKSYDKVWFNGLKVFVLHFPYLLSYEGDVFFHLRDYIVKNKVMGFILEKLIDRGVNLHIIANSNDVKDDFETEYGYLNIKVKTCYNPCQKFDSLSIKKVQTISLASMLTPWKGIHMFLDFVHFYHQELKEIGIANINIFGDTIYKTGSKKSSYKCELKEIVERNKLDLVSFRGRVSAANVFQDTDLLIHSSIEKEPFGRVILESMGSGIPVLSTGLGGALEIFEGHEHLIFKPYDYPGLFKKIKDLVESDNSELIKSLRNKYLSMNKQSSQSFLDFIVDGL